MLRLCLFPYFSNIFASSFTPTGLFSPSILFANSFLLSSALHPLSLFLQFQPLFSPFSCTFFSFLPSLFPLLLPTIYSIPIAPSSLSHKVLLLNFLTPSPSPSPAIFFTYFTQLSTSFFSSFSFSLPSHLSLLYLLLYHYLLERGGAEKTGSSPHHLYGPYLYPFLPMSPPSSSFSLSLILSLLLRYIFSLCHHLLYLPDSFLLFLLCPYVCMVNVFLYVRTIEDA